MTKGTIDKISKLHPSVRDEVTKIINEINTSVLTGDSKVIITQGLRTFTEQDALYAQGRTKPGKKVTNAKGGQSVHNYGFACDIALIIKDKEVSWDTKKDWDKDNQSDWMEVVSVFKKYGWSWGGDWISFKDMPHFDKKGFGDWKKLLKLNKDKDGYLQFGFASTIPNKKKYVRIATLVIYTFIGLPILMFSPGIISSFDNIPCVFPKSI